MARKKRSTQTPPNARAEDLPANPEFQEFAENLRKIIQVPKEEIDRRVAEERDKRRKA